MEKTVLRCYIENGKRKFVEVKKEIVPVKYPKVPLKKRSALDKATGVFTKEGIEDLIVNADKLVKTSKKLNANRRIAELYDNYCKENCIEGSHKADRVAKCLSMFDVDYYAKQGFKDIKRVNLCKDKFCLNCQSQLSMHRYAKYAPVLDELLKDYKIFHVVLTVPNCSGIMLKPTLNKMTFAFAQLIRYFQGKKIKGVDFLSYQFAGAIKSIEIKVNEKGFLSEFHPHYHCLFVFKHFLFSKNITVNKYSFKKSEFSKDRRVKKDGGVNKRYFSDFEILLQKVWYLLFNSCKVTKSSIDKLDLGYSCYAQRVVSDYKEVFKYSLKGLYDPKSSQFLYSQETFNYLYEAIHRKKAIQGYGILNKFNFIDDVDIAELEEYYSQRIIALRQIEDPLVLHESLSELLNQLKKPDIKYISKNSLYTKFLKERGKKF